MRPGTDVCSDNRPTADAAVPAPKDDGPLIEDTLQLALCARLLASNSKGEPASSANPTTGVSSIQEDYIQLMVDNPLEEEHLFRMLNQMADTFVLQPSNDPDSIQEVLLVAPMLDKKHFRGLIRHFLDEFEKSVMLRVDILLGLVQLVQDAPAMFLKQDDMTRVLRSVREHLKDSAHKSREDTIYLMLATSVLLSISTTDLNFDQQQEPFLKIFSTLKNHSDPLIKIQAKYATQTLISSSRQSTVDGLDEIDGTSGIIKQLKTALGSSGHRQWFQEIRKAQGYIRDHLFSDVKNLICEGPCRGNINFQWHVCQLLGEIAVDPTWNNDDRDQAIALLYGFIKTDAGVERDSTIKSWALTILRYISESPAVLCRNGTLSQEVILGDVRNDKARSIIKEFQLVGLKPLEFAFPLTGRLPLPTSSPLFVSVTTDPDVEFAIGCLRRQRSRVFDKRAVYIQLLSKQSLRSSEDVLVALQERTRDFLDSKKEVLLVLGDSGAGKSTFGMRLENDLWDEYKPGGPIPLFIDLKSIEMPDKDMVQQHLEDQGYFSEQQLEELRQSRQFVLICDGYDECHQWTNLHARNHFNEPRQWQAKMIVSCRTQYLGPNYRNYFEPESTALGNLNFSHTSDLFEEAVIVPFKTAQIKEYVELYTQMPRTPDHLGSLPVWTMEQYMERLRSIAHLMELAQNPFMLRMIMDVLPRIAKTTTKMTRVDLYDSFVELHFESEQQRLLRQQSNGKMDDDTLSTFTALKNDDLVHSGLNFSKQLSLSIFREQGGLNSVTYSTTVDSGSWKDAFFGSDAKAKLLRESAQLVCRENRQDTRQLIRHRSRLARKRNSYEFSHRSILEYFFSCLIFDPRGNEASLDLSTCLDGSGNSKLIVDHPLGQMSIVPKKSIVQFLADRVQQHDGLRKHLRTIVEMSKDEAIVSLAAANSITILVEARNFFNGVNLQGVRVPGADLSGGKFDSAQLQGVDFTGARLNLAWLRQADLSGATMTDVRFGEKPYYEIPDLQSLAISLDGSILAVGLGTGDVKVYQTVGFLQPRTFQGHTDFVESVAISNDGSLVASGSDDKTVRLWSLKGGDNHVLRGHSNFVRIVSFSPDNRHIASTSLRGTVRVWNVESGSCVHVLENSLVAVLSTAWSPCGRHIASTSFSSEGGLNIWNAETGKRDRILDVKQVQNIIYSRQGKLAVVGGTKSVVIWDPASSNKDDKPTIINGTKFSSVCFSQNERTIAVACNDSVIQLWDWASGSIITSLSGHFGFIITVSFLNDEELMSASEDGTVRFWQLKDEIVPQGKSFDTPGPGITRHYSTIVDVVYSPNGEFILSSGGDHILRWNTKTGEGAIFLEVGKERCTMAFSPKGRQLAVTKAPSVVLEGRQELTIATDHGFTAANGLTSVVKNGSLKVYQLDDTDGPKEESHFDSPARRVAYSACGRWMALGEDGGIVRLWDLQSFENEWVLEEHSDYILKLLFLPNGRQLISLCYAGTICLWDMESGVCTEILDVYGTYISASPCGNILAIAEGNVVHLWDLQKQKELTVLTGFSNIASMEWSPKSNWILIGCDDNTVRLWRISDDGQELKGSEVIVIRDFLGWTFCVAWHPTDPMEFATGSIDGSICTWRIVQDQDQDDAFHVQLIWDSSTNRLTSSGTLIHNVTGLSEVQKHLLRQRGAIDGFTIPGTEQHIVRHTEGDRKAHVIGKTLFYR